MSAAAVLAVFVVVFAGQAAADESQTLSITGPTVNESDGTATFTVSLSAGTDRRDVDYTTADGSATAGRTTPRHAGNVTVTAGDSVTINVPILNDSSHESTETFTVDTLQRGRRREHDGDARPGRSPTMTRRRQSRSAAQPR